MVQLHVTGEGVGHCEDLARLLILEQASTARGAMRLASASRYA
jgi:hypothetical protein